jgi:hypothetical protein
MPINPTARSRSQITGSSRKADPEQIAGIFGFIGLHELAPVFTNWPPRKNPADHPRGRRSPYPPLALLATLASARVTGSLTSSLALLHHDGQLWKRCVDAFEQRSKVRLPPTAPNRDQVTHFRNTLTADPGHCELLQMTFRRLAVGQARCQGNLRTGVEPDWANPLEAHAIYGDGTVIAKYSDVHMGKDPATGNDVVLGSRAKDPARARIQRFTYDPREDHKEGAVPNGLNMVAMHTWTPSGRVTLGTAVALRGEAWAAMDLADSLHEIAGDGIHSLIYDRAITGWHVDALMANCRIQVIGKAVGAPSEDAAWERSTSKDVKDIVQRRIAEYRVEPTTDASFLVRHDVISDMLRYHDRMPLGMCIYPTSRRRLDLVHSWSHELDPAVHDGPNGPCVHRIAVDDGGLFEIAEHPQNDGQVVKTRMLRCLHSTPFKRADGRWGRRNRYTISCPHGDIEYTHAWEPVGTRHTPDSEESNRAPKDPVGWRLRPLSRADDIAAWYNAESDVDHFQAPRPFSDVYSRRNDSECFNEWFQQSLPHHGRATSLHMAAQELDFLLGALLNNMITWSNRH